MAVSLLVHPLQLEQRKIPPRAGLIANLSPDLIAPSVSEARGRRVFTFSSCDYGGCDVAARSDPCKKDYSRGDNESQPFG